MVSFLSLIDLIIFICAVLSDGHYEVLNRLISKGANLNPAVARSFYNPKIGDFIDHLI